MRFGPVNQYLFVDRFHIMSKHACMSVDGVESGEKKKKRVPSINKNRLTEVLIVLGRSSQRKESRLVLA